MDSEIFGPAPAAINTIFSRSTSELLRQAAAELNNLIARDYYRVIEPELQTNDLGRPLAEGSVRLIITTASGSRDLFWLWRRVHELEAEAQNQ